MKFKKAFSDLFENIVLKFIHLKHFYPYLFVHKPLCAKYRVDSMNIGNLFICRSCFFLYLGVLLAFILYKYINISFSFLLMGLTIIVLLSNPFYYRFYSRITRDASRFFLGFLTIIYLIKMYSYDKLLFASSILCLLIVKHLYNTQRQKVDLCSNCNELTNSNICIGYTMQANAILQIEEEMSNYIMYRRWRFKND